MNVVVLAGGQLSAEDPLYKLVPVERNKAHLPLKGKPMLQWVLDALGGSKLISGVIVVGQEPDDSFSCSKPLTYLPDNGGLVENILAGVKQSMLVSPEEKCTLVASGDIPLVTAAMVDWVVENGLQSGAELLYQVISDEIMEARFPGSKRTFVPLKGVSVCGGDLNMIANPVVEQHKELWTRLAASRKNPLKQAAIFGPVILIGVLLRRFSLEDVAVRLSKRLGLKAQAVLCPFAELGMDIDKLHQYELVRAEMEAS